MQIGFMRWVILGVLSQYIYAGGGKNITPALSDIAKVIDANSGLYIGIGLGTLRLSNDYSNEYFQTHPVQLIAGYKFNPYFSIEGRYTKDVSNVIYRHGTTINPDNNDFSADFGSYSLLARFSYPYQKYTPYFLIGYGSVFLNDIKESKRHEEGLQYGLGIAYALTSSCSLFVDYIHLYSGNGFQGRAEKVDVEAHSFTMGAKYVF